MEGSCYRGAPIIVPNVKRAVEQFPILTMSFGSPPFTLGLIGPRVSTMRKWSGHGRDQPMTDTRAAHGVIRLILVKPLVEHDSIKTQISRARERRVAKRSWNRVRLYTKRNLRMKKFSFCIMESPFRQKQRGLALPNQLFWKGLGNRRRSHCWCCCLRHYNGNHRCVHLTGWCDFPKTSSRSVGWWSLVSRKVIGMPLT